MRSRAELSIAARDILRLTLTRLPKSARLSKERACFLYLRSGMYDKANALIRSLPHIWESREILMPEVYSGEEYTKKLKKCILKVLTFLCQKIDVAPERQVGATPAYIQLGVDFTPKASADDLLSRIKAYLGS